LKLGWNIGFFCVQSKIQALYARTEKKGLPMLQRATPREGNNLTEAQKAFAALPPQEMRIRKRIMSHIPFVTPVSVEKNVPGRDEDGLLPTLLFQRFFICGADITTWFLIHADSFGGQEPMSCGLRFHFPATLSRSAVLR